MTHNTVIVGYKYSLGVHMTLCHGPIDGIEEIRVAARTAWEGDYTGSGSLDYQEIGSRAGQWPIGAPTSPQPKGYILTVQYRRDRVVLDRDTLEPRVVIGTEDNDNPDPDPPPTPSGALSLAIVRSRSETDTNVFPKGRMFFEIDNTARDADIFEDPDNDLQVSFTGGLPTLPQYEVSSGAIKTEQIGASLFIDAPDLFGGERNEGGIRGRVSVALGTATQGVNEYLQRVLGSVPAFRHVAALVLEQVYVGTTGRVKPWAVTTRREPRASGLDPQYASIGPDANPAHILYELVRSNDFGMGYSEARIETAEFEAAAQTLHGEGFGLSLLWKNAREDVEAFRRRVCEHIDASMYVDPDTAKFRLKLHRDDYVTADLPLLDRSNVVEVVEFGRPGYGELVNKVSLIYTDGEDGPEGERPSWKAKTVTQHDLGALRAQGGRVVSKEVAFDGICKASLANKVLSRELRQRSRPLARSELILSSDESDIRPGDVRRWADSEYGVEQIVIRVLEVKYGTIRDRRVRVKAVEDVFGTADAVYADPTPTQWTEPVVAPAPAPYRRLTEATYRHYAEALSESATLLGEIPDDRARLVTQAVGPAENTFGYQVQIDSGSGYHPDDDEGEHCPTALLARGTGPGETLLVFQQGDSVELDSVDTDTWAYLGDEIVAVRSIDPVANTATVDRGVIDTVPHTHAVGTRIFFGEGFETYSAHTYTDGEQLDVKLLPTTSGGTLALTDAPADTITFNNRFIRPYPPGNVQIAGERYPELLFAPLTVTWSHRDRTQQTGTLVAQDAGDIGPEPGTTYTLRVIDRSNGQQLVEKTGLTGTSYDDSDGADTLTPTSAPVQITLELSSQRDGFDSWQTHQIDTDRRGYAFAYNDAAGNLTYGGFAANA